MEEWEIKHRWARGGAGVYVCGGWGGGGGAEAGAALH